MPSILQLLSMVKKLVVKKVDQSLMGSESPVSVSKSPLPEDVRVCALALPEHWLCLNNTCFGDFQGDALCGGESSSGTGMTITKSFPIIHELKDVMRLTAADANEQTFALKGLWR